METPVGEHIRRLEERLSQLNTQIMENSRDLAERNRIEAKIRAAYLAIAHYRAALRAEAQRTRTLRPSASPDAGVRPTTQPHHHGC